jgi:uncharacterized protein
MRLGGLIPIIILTIVLALVLTIGSVLSNLNLPQITIDNKNDASKQDSNDSDRQVDRNNKTGLLTINTDDGKTHKFNVEVADTPEKRALGLMGRTKLADNAGMLFVYGEQDLHGFWMKDTLIPLDLIHINNNEVVEIIERMQTCDTNKKDFILCPSYPASTPSKYSMEVKAGTVERLEIRVGDKVKIEL